MLMRLTSVFAECRASLNLPNDRVELLPRCGFKSPGIEIEFERISS